jgi:hypothetical protein
VTRSEVGVERVEALRRRGVGVGCHQVQRRHRGPAAERREAHAAVAGDDGRHALAELRRHRRVRQQQAVVVRVHVDEAGCDRQAVEFDYFGAVGRRAGAHRRDRAALQHDIGAARGRPRAVDHQPAPEHHAALHVVVVLLLRVVCALRCEPGKSTRSRCTLTAHPCTFVVTVQTGLETPARGRAAARERRALIPLPGPLWNGSCVFVAPLRRAHDRASGLCFLLRRRKT